jgi:hypothetical protein
MKPISEGVLFQTRYLVRSVEIVTQFLHIVVNQPSNKVCVIQSINQPNEEREFSYFALHNGLQSGAYAYSRK